MHTPAQRDERLSPGGLGVIRVLLVDDHEMVRRGLVEILESEPGIEIVGEAATVRQGAARITATIPDVAVIDVHLPDGSGIDLCRRVRQNHPSVRVLILTGFDDDDAVLSAVIADASGYVLKSVRGSDLVASVRSVARGRRLIGPALAQRAAHRARSFSDADPRFGSLSIRERQILSLIAEALTNREISQRLGLSEKTVKNYVSKLLIKLGLEHRTQAAVFELERSRAEG